MHSTSSADNTLLRTPKMHHGTQPIIEAMTAGKCENDVVLFPPAPKEKHSKHMK
jgi:hypothetical protein